MDFIAGEVLYFNKPLKWTSFDLVNKFRYKLSRKLKVKKIKVGHAGTLDPLATGVSHSLMAAETGAPFNNSIFISSSCLMVLCHQP